MTTSVTKRAVPAPIAHVMLGIVSILPLFVPVPTNVNIIVTASVTVLCGCLRSVKDEAPQESMTQKVSVACIHVVSRILLQFYFL